MWFYAIEPYSIGIALVVAALIWLINAERQRSADCRSQSMNEDHDRWKTQYFTRDRNEKPRSPLTDAPLDSAAHRDPVRFDG
jgi:hypothetical protein